MSSNLPSPSSPLTLLRTSPAAITKGDVVSGVVRFNVSSAEKLSLVDIVVALRGKIMTVTGHGEGKKIQVTQIFRLPQTLWAAGQTVATDASGIAEFAWSLQMPSDDNLPPSFGIGKPKRHLPGSAVMYYVHLKGSRKGKFTSAIRINSPLLFMPPPFIESLPPMLGSVASWTSALNTKKVRRGLFGESGYVDIKLSIPELEIVPLYHPIPYRLMISCKSKPLSNDIAQFDFPRNPLQSNVFLTLRQECALIALKKRETVINRTPPLGGLGPSPSATKSPTAQIEKGASSDATEEVFTVSFEISEPRWDSEREKGGTVGNWKESVMFAGTFVLKAQPPFAYETISYKAYLDVKTQFPGIGNNVEVSMGPLRLLAPPPSTIFEGALAHVELSPADGKALQPSNPLPPAFASLDLPPSYWETLDLDPDGKDDD